MTDIGYIRVSSVDQNTDRQLSDVQLDKVFTDKCSGKDVERPQLKELMQTLVEEITNKGVTLKFYKENLTFNGDESPLQKLMLQMMGAFAEFERELIHERQREGIEAAKAKGKRFGAKPKLSKTQVRDIKRRTKTGEGKSALAKEYGVSRQTLYNVL